MSTATEHAGGPRRLHVSLVAADRKVWAGAAEMVIARTTEGDTGILPGHQPILSILQPSVVIIRGTERGLLEAVVSGGFVSVAGNDVSVLAESVLLPDEISAADARDLLASARAVEHNPASDKMELEEAAANIRFAEAQLRVLGSPAAQH
jgi:F-type H+-transporting ATPase subunit epsilon